MINFLGKIADIFTKVIVYAMPIIFCGAFAYYVFLLPACKDALNRSTAKEIWVSTPPPPPVILNHSSYPQAVATPKTLSSRELTKVLAAIRVVESNNNPDAVGDGGNAIGVYQIWNNYWIDATQYSGIGGEYSDCHDADYADKIVRAYMKRYATEKRIGRKVTQEDIARMHNGGPNALKASGKKKENLDNYWSKVQKELLKKNRNKRKGQQ